VNIARHLTAPLGLAFSAVTNARQKLYGRQVLKSSRLAKPVISVGNLTVGGTGKTPVVDVLLSDFEKRGLRAAVLTRGYGRGTSRPVVIDSATTADEAGDEPAWLYQRHPAAKIAVSADRVEGARLAGDVDVFILDDGLQHFQIQRDVDIALVDATRPLCDYRPLPWGHAREDWSALKRCDLVIVTRSNQTTEEHLDRILHLVREQGIAEVILSSIEFGGAFDLNSNQEMTLAGRKVYLVSGIANPKSFENLVVTQEVGAFRGHRLLKDHAVYSQALIGEILGEANRVGADCLLMTEKDAVKWKNILGATGRSAALDVGVVRSRLAFNPELPDIYGLASYHRR
jgi:tetraacyldisaccharide 4'-kinase